MSKKNKDKDKTDFLLGLRELTLKFGIEIVGCGCCGSPWLKELKKGDNSHLGGYAVNEENEYLTFYQPPALNDSEMVKKEWELNKDKIVIRRQSTYE